MTEQKSQRTTAEQQTSGDPMAAYANESPEQAAEHQRQIAEQEALEHRTVTPPLAGDQSPEPPPENGGGARTAKK